MSLHTQAMKGTGMNNAPIRKAQPYLLKYLKLLNIIWYIEIYALPLWAKFNQKHYYDLRKTFNYGNAAPCGSLLLSCDSATPWSAEIHKF